MTKRTIPLLATLVAATLIPWGPAIDGRSTPKTVSFTAISATQTTGLVWLPPTTTPETTTTAAVVHSTEAERPTTTQRASRSLPVPRKVQIVEEDWARRNAPAVEDGIPPGCHVPGKRSRAEAHRCWDHLINKYSWPKVTAFNVMFCESEGDPFADNPRSSATGLFQILGGTTDPAANVHQAHGMWQQRGWRPWSQCL